MKLFIMQTIYNSHFHMFNIVSSGFWLVFAILFVIVVVCSISSETFFPELTFCNSLFYEAK